MRKNSLLHAFLCLCFFSMQAHAQLPASAISSSQATQVGVVAAIKGKVEIIDKKQVGRNVESGETIFLGDEVRTGAKGQLQIMLLDETIFTIGPKSAMVIDEFVYDPKTANGKVDARIIEGAFRLITGKIGEKKPKNVSIQLPVGSVGIRGTIVYGNVQGETSQLLLLGPGAKNNTQHKTGAIIVENETEDGEIESTEINKSGFSTTIPGAGQAPTDPVQLSEEETQEMIGALGGGGSESEDEDEDADQGAASNSNKPSNDDEGDDAISGSDNASDDAGQSTAGAIEVVDDVGDLGNFSEDLADDVLDSVQDSLDDDDDFNGVFDGLATLKNLDFAADNDLIQGKVRYQSSGHTLSKVGATEKGTFDFYIVVDFDNRSIGGDGSKVEATHLNILSGTTQVYNINSESWESASSDGNNASFSFENINDSGLGGCTACSADVVVSLNNVDGEIAELGQVSLNIETNSDSYNGTGSAEQQAVI
jgi:hypothetical protein